VLAVRARSVILAAAGLLGLVGDEHDALHLPGVVESEDADVVVGVGLLALLELGVHLGGVGAAEHGQLPHGPVAAIVVPGRSGVLTEDEADLAELEARDPVVPDQVVDLLQEVLRGEWWQVRQGLELLVVLSRPHLHAPDPSAVADVAEALAAGAAADGEPGSGLEALERSHGGGRGGHHGGSHGLIY